MADDSANSMGPRHAARPLHRGRRLADLIPRAGTSRCPRDGLRHPTAADGPREGGAADQAVRTTGSSSSSTTPTTRSPRKRDARGRFGRRPPRLRSQALSVTHRTEPRRFDTPAQGGEGVAAAARCCVTISRRLFRPALLARAAARERRHPIPAGPGRRRHPPRSRDHARVDPRPPH